jgi:hypothetical protein
MKKKTKALNWSIVGMAVLFLVIAFSIGYYLGNIHKDVPSYIKSGVTTFVFTTPHSSVYSDSLSDCNLVANTFIQNIFHSGIQCSFSSSKYFPGEIDCVCLIK